MNKNSDVAVIMSVYAQDNATFFETSVNSLIKQTYPCDIHIYCDGVLPNELELVLYKYHENKNFFIYRCNENKGLTHALNYLLDHVLLCGYTYIARMDADDISFLDRIECQVSYFSENHSVDVLGGFCEEFGSDFCLTLKKLPQTHTELVDFSIRRSPFIHPSVMFRSAVFESGIRYPNIKFTEDLGLWYELLLQGAEFANLDKPLIKYRLSNDTLNRRGGYSKAFNELRLRFKFMKKSKNVSLKNLFFIATRFIFHFLPRFCLSIAYKYFR